MLIKTRAEIKSSEITEEHVYLDRRRFMQSSMAALIGSMAPSLLRSVQAADLFSKLKQSKYSSSEKLTSFDDITRYNNFYEFSMDKKGPAKLAANFKTRPWTVTVEGEIDKPAVYDIDSLIKSNQLEERIYRLRCVEAWSMVVPWVGIPLANIIKRVKPNSRAKYVQFVTLHDPEQMPGQKPRLFSSSLNWPYVEGLRMDEAMNPLALLAVGLYGKSMPNQNGAPIRLVVPWKYGFKSIKSIVKIRFVEKIPPTTWSESTPDEYGFYANVNPTVDHPRWSQKKERRIGEDSIFSPKRKTLMFNGYADEVASLYAGMDLRKFF